MTIGWQTEIVAEVANAHQGDPDQAISIAEAALKAGADAVKFQVYSAEELLVRSHPRYEHFSRQAFSQAVWTDLLSHFVCRKEKVYCDVFGLDALGIALEAEVHGIKIHSSDLSNYHLLDIASEQHKRVLLAVGGSTVKEIAQAVNQLTKDGASRRPMLLHGFQSYPTAVKDSCLERLAWLKEMFGDRCDVGYMDHVDAGDRFATIVPLMALSFGVTMLEKHVTMDRSAKGVDYFSSFNPDEFATFVQDVRKAESALSDQTGLFSKEERHYRDTVKKHWVAVTGLKKGQQLAASDLVMKRVPQSQIFTIEFDRLVGRELSTDIGAQQVLTCGDVMSTVWACIVARSGSSRLPGKATLDFNGMPALAHLFARIRQAKSVDHMVFCTTTEVEDDHLVRLAESCGVTVHRGDRDDVLGRQLGAIEGNNVDIVVRVTGDDILVDPDYLDRAVAHHLGVNAEYTDLKSLPSGTEVEVFDAELMRTIHNGAMDPYGTEYLTTYVINNCHQFRTTSCPVDPEHQHDWRLTLDTEEDREAIRRLLEGMCGAGKATDYRLDDIVAFIKEHPGIIAINANIRQRQTPPEVDTRIDWSRLL